MFEDVEAVAVTEPAALVAPLLALSDDDIEALELAQAEGLVVATQRVINALTARQAAAIETVARRCDEAREVEAAEIEAQGGRPFHTTGDQVAAGSLAALLHVSPRTMSTRVDRSRRLVCLLPEVHRLAREGELEPYRVEAIVRESRAVDPSRLHEFEARVLEADVTGMPTSQLRARARRCALRCTGAQAQDLSEAARARRGVWVGPGDEPGMSRLVADLPTPTAQRVWSAVDGLAAEYLRANPGLAAGAARADALTDLVEAYATISTTVELVAPIDATFGTGATGLPAHTFTGCAHGHGSADDPDAGAGGWGEGCEELDDGVLHESDEALWFVSGPATLPTLGVLLPDDVVALLQDPDVTVRLARSDHQTGAIRWQDPTAYRPSARTARAVRSRDGTCRFPGCGTPAKRCQLDHVERFPDGPTDVTNLQSLCATHHGFKHHAGWLVEMDEVGVCTWTAPDGREHTTWPLDRHGRRAA